LHNPYGASKKAAEEALRRWAQATESQAVIYRLRNVFGKWCRPHYNSVVATFCHNVAHGVPLSVVEPQRELELVYIDDVVRAFMAELDAPAQAGTTLSRDLPPSGRITVGALAELIRSFRESRTCLVLPDCGDRFTRCLYATYLSYLEPPDFGYALTQRTDARGALAEFIKSPHAGQVFVSTTRPGVTRGNHYHHTKVEKFLVLSGEAEIRFRHILGTEVVTHRVTGREFKVVDIPPGWTHAITNVGATDLVVLFWASEVLDPAAPDTYYAEVDHA